MVFMTIIKVKNIRKYALKYINVGRIRKTFKSTEKFHENLWKIVNIITKKVQN